MSRKRPHGRSPAVYAEIRGFYTYTYASNVVEESVSDLHAGLIPASQITVLSFFSLFLSGNAGHRMVSPRTEKEKSQGLAMPLLGFCFPIQAGFAWLPSKRRYTGHFLSLPSFFFLSLSFYTSQTTIATMARGRSRNANKRSVALNAALSIGPRKFRFKMCICLNAGKFHIMALRVC